MKKKLLVLALAFAMILAFAGCGGGGGGESAEPAEAAEPNAGVGGITFVVPDGWEQTEFTLGSYSAYAKPDSDLKLRVSVFTEKDLEDLGEYADAKDLQEFFDKYYAVREEQKNDSSMETSEIKVNGIDATLIKRTNSNNEYVLAGTSWIQDNSIYDLFIGGDHVYAEGGKINDSAPVMSDEDMAAVEAALASVSSGDGNALQKTDLAADSYSSFAFTAPEGYSLTSLSSDYVTFKKDGNDDTSLTVSITDEAGLQTITLEDGKHPESLKAFYDYMHQYDDPAEIAGYSGSVSKYPYEDDRYYDATASFLTDEEIYEIRMSVDAFDTEGNIKEGVEALTEDDLAAFDAFVASFKAK